MDVNHLSWLPGWPPSLTLLSTLALTLLLGSLLAGTLRKAIGLPETSAFLLSGLAFGSSGLGLVSVEMLGGLSVVADFALGMVLFTLGRRVDPVWLLRERWLLVTGVLQSLIVFSAVFLVLREWEVSVARAMAVAAVISVTSPSITLRIVQETRSEGQITERMLHAVAIQCLMGALLFGFGLQLVHLENDAGWMTTLFHPLYFLLGSAVLGVSAAALVRVLCQQVRLSHEFEFVLILGFMGLLVEANDVLKLSPLVSLLIFGIASRGYGRNLSLRDPSGQAIQQVVFAFLFMYLGMSLSFDMPSPPLLAGLTLIMLRWVLVTTPALMLAKFNGLTLKGATLWGGAMFPISGISVLLVNHVTDMYPGSSADFWSWISVPLLLSYVLGPLVCWVSLRLAGEARIDS